MKYDWLVTGFAGGPISMPDECLASETRNSRTQGFAATAPVSNYRHFIAVLSARVFLSSGGIAKLSRKGNDSTRTACKLLFEQNFKIGIRYYEEVIFCFGVNELQILIAISTDTKIEA